MLGEILVLIKGAGDLGTGVAYRLHRAGMQVVMTEVAQPTVVRRAVAFAEAVYEGEMTVESLCARLVEGLDNEMSRPIRRRDYSARRRDISSEGVRHALAEGVVPVLIDPQARIALELRPQVVVDARMAKRNLGTQMSEAQVVIGLGPGFVAGRDVHAVVETLRGHRLGRVILEGEATPNTGVSCPVGDKLERRVLRAPAEGVFRALKRIGDAVAEGEVVAQVDGRPVRARLSGVLRGILHDGLTVRRGMKVSDVDPRGVRDCCFTISDRALAVGGGVLEAILHLLLSGRAKVRC